MNEPINRISVHRRFSHGKCLDCGTAFVIDAEGGPACPKCDASDLAEALERARAELRERDEALARLSRDKLANIATAAERDIDDGSIKLTGEAADRELARLAEQKHKRAELRARLHVGIVPFDGFVPSGVVPPALAELAAPCVDCGEPLNGASGTLCARCAKWSDAENEAKATLARAHAIAAEARTTEVHVELPAGFVPEHVYTNRTTKAVTFNGGELKRTLQHSGPVAFPTVTEAESLAFCLRIALEHDHGGAKRLRRLLFAWHNATELGGFDFSDLWSLDDSYRRHALIVINMIARSPQGWYAEHYGYAADMTAIVETYGPGR